jgi:hypothetical protein
MEVKIEFEGVEMTVAGEYHPFVRATCSRDGWTTEEHECFEHGMVMAGSADITSLVECFKDVHYNKFIDLCFSAAKEAIEDKKEDRAAWDYEQRRENMAYATFGWR